MRDPNRRSAHESSSIDGWIPQAASYPASEDDVVSALREARESDRKVFICGGRTRAEWGKPVEGLDLILSTTGLMGDIDLRVDDLTVAAPAGMRVLDLSNLLAKQGLFLPLDPSGGGFSTVGGAVATGSSSYQRATYGTVRDIVLGMRVALPSGQIVRFGGRTVKNVSGYDLCKLFTGSWGTLGCITEATFRVHAFPPASSTVVALLRGGTVVRAVQEVLDGEGAPAAFEVLAGFDPSDFAIPSAPGPRAAPVTHMLLVRFSGPPAGVRAQCDEIAQMVAAAGATGVYCLGGEEESRLWQRRLEICDSLGSGGVRIAVSTPPGAWAEMLASVSEFAAENRLGLRGSVMPLNGVATFGLSGGDGPCHSPDPERSVDLSRLASGLSVLAQRTEGARGRLRVLAGPLQVRKEFYTQNTDPAGPSRLALRIKRLFDPGMILAPGKMP